MFKKITISFFLILLVTSVIYSQDIKQEKKKKEQFSRRLGSGRNKTPKDNSDGIKLNTFRTSIKLDAVKGIQRRPRISFEIFLSEKISIETGLGTFGNGRRIYNNIYIYQSTNPYWYMGFGPAKGYDGYLEIKRLIKAKYSTNKQIRFVNHVGVGFYFRYSHFDKAYQIYEIHGGDDHYSTCLQSETSRIYCLKFTYDANIKGKKWNHFYLNPYISIMPGISYSNVIIQDILIENAVNSYGYYSFDKQIYTAFKEIGLKLCWGIGKKKESSLEK